MAHAKPFNRGLSAEFLSELVGGRFAPLVSRARAVGLDLQIRDDYVNLYHQGRSALKLSERRRPPGYRALIHEEYLHNVTLSETPENQRDYRDLDASAGFVEDYLGQLPLILANVEEHALPEGTVEQAIITANCLNASPVILVDRQIQVPGVSRKADLVGLAGPDHDRFAIIELKQGLDQRIQDLISQIAQYYQVLTGPEGALRPDIHQAYRRVIEQKQKLGFLPKGVGLPSGQLPVECLLVLYDYNPRSVLLDRLRTAARESSLRVKLAMLPARQFVLPPEEDWEVL